MIQAAAMEQMMGGGMGGGMGGDPMGGAPMGPDPFASEAPPGYTMVFVPDNVLPSVMELVGQGDPMASSGAMGGQMAPPSAQPPMY